ncbi:MAG: peptide chain release factor 2 [Candidatus Margulisbacteria bacterium GWF2_38_17]|nr:MAG: peptide chain release factor 2 [Candidatus Margulisbacteria bacterium GWD2_39_127]OGI02001.1 MAG: peptide chain release factor 2 [Candidatus Margulisbacteria bacterium GWF2_38_17]OGI11396.1 MAG: peptide chain release factor 2 [Candidatus Margulisbacteria bacterium GWE2_39_32]
MSELEKQSESQDFWNKPDSANKVVKELSIFKQKFDRYQKLYTEISDQLEFINLLLEENEADDEHAEDLKKTFDVLYSEFQHFEIESLLNGPYDNNNGIFVITAGAGGTDAQDWALMLFRMYTRFFERQGFRFEVSDYSPGDEAGIKGATILVEGLYAYGYLKNEIGIHRLVRISPFNANGKRQTSFASVDVIPQVEEDKNTIISPEEIRIDTYRSSGAGGQHVNKTDSAVRITHIPTGLVVQCQAGRSQTKNKEMAMHILYSKLYNLKMDQQKESLSKARSEKKEIGWGNQIRSYVFHPYSLVKDHRTKIETGNVNSVMDGDIAEFIEGYLRSQVQ